MTADRDDPYSHPVGVPAARQRAVTAVRALDARLGRQPTAFEQGLDRLAANPFAPDPHARRLAHPDYSGESTRERNARLHRPVVLQMMDEDYAATGGW